MVALKNETDFKDIKKVFLLMGPQCNMRCRHCSQMPIKVGEKIEHIVSPDVWMFLEHYISYAISHEGFARNLVLWGGEPLLHWDFIKEVVTKFTDKFKLLEVPRGRFLFSIVTNGLLLDEEKLDFIRKYRMKVSLSYDAPDPFAVRGHVPEEKCRMLASSGVNYSTISTFNALNCDYYLACRCMRKKFPKVRHCFNFALMQTFEEMPEDIMAYDWDKIRYSLKKLRIAASLGDLDAAMMIAHLMWPLRYPQDCTTFHNYRVKACFSGNGNYSVMLNGDVVTCHNSSEKIGTISDSGYELWKKSLEAFASRKSPACETCEHNDVCIGNCAFSVKEKDGTFVSCNVYRIQFFTELKREMKMLMQPVSDEEKKWFDEECRKDDKIVEEF